LKLDIKTVAPMHGIVVPFTDLQKAASASSTPGSGKS
jgi:hypothetical protein